MNQTEKRLFLIRSLLNEQPRYQGMVIPNIEAEQKWILRSLFNIRMPGEISDEFLDVQDEYLREKRFYVMAAATVAAANGEADHNFSFQVYRKISECIKIMEMKTMDRRLIEFVGLTIPAGFVLPEDVHDEIVTFRSEVLFFH